MEDNSYIQLKNITKKFGTVKANENINLDVRSGEIHALLGENGSGKSTLMSILSGIYSPDEGSIYIGGKEVSFDSPKAAINAGIGMVHQHFKLVDVLTAQENIIAGYSGGLFIDKAKMTEKIIAICKKYGLVLNPHKKIYNMSVGEKQTIEIIKVLYRGANVLILDEPTAVLTPQETKVLFDIMRNMKREGCAVIIITHKMNEVLEISDRVTVLRKGESICTLDTKKTTAGELTELMVGKAINLDIPCVSVEPSLVKQILEVKNLTVLNGERRTAVDSVSFTLNSGEILGVAGIADSGQKELCEAITGMQKIKNGEIIFNGESLVGLSPRDIIRCGISLSFVPEDRLGMGLVAGMDIVDNVLLKSYH
ncbi:MAG: ATP-binding cassette domain-containing protein, partial [Oscillospiraceae bacterium]